MSDTGGCLVSPQPPRFRVCVVDYGITASTGIAHRLICPPILAGLARGLHLIVNRLYRYVAIMPQMEFLLVPISSCFGWSFAVIHGWRQEIGIVPRSAAR